MPFPRLQQLAVPAACFLISFLAYSSQLLFHYTESEFPAHRDAVAFNVLVACLWVSYGRAVMTSPGRVPQDWEKGGYRSGSPNKKASTAPARQRWCRKCEAYKPPRAHHCKVCMRYIQFSMEGSSAVQLTEM